MKHLLIPILGLLLCVPSQGEEVAGATYTFTVPSNTRALVIEDAVDWFRFDWSTGVTNSTLVLHPHENVSTEAQSIAAAKKCEAEYKKEALRLKDEMHIRVSRRSLTNDSLRGFVVSLHIKPAHSARESWQHHLFVWDETHPLFGLLTTDSPDAVAHALTIIRSRKVIANKTRKGIAEEPTEPVTSTVQDTVGKPAE